jgi:hypothetical protein
MSLLNLVVTSIFFLKCSGFACPPGPHRSSASGPSHIFNGSSPYKTSLTSLTNSGQTVKLDFQTSLLILGQPVDTTGSFSLGATDVLSFTLSQTTNGSATVELQYGTFFSGIKAVTYSFHNNIINGNVDGRVLNQFGPSSSNTTLTFADGHGTPNVRIAPELATSNFNSSLQDIQSRILSNESCNMPLARSVPFTDTQLLSDLQFRQNNLDYSQDPGHSSNTMGSVGCVVCTTELGLYGAAGSAYCVGVCAALWFTSDCPNCWNNLNNNVNSLTTRCEENFCCPVDCGQACCDLGEACLSPSSGLCCSGGESPCGGKTCCEGDQVCMPDGSCCPAAAAIDGTCCPADGICDSACCGLLLECMAPGLCCAPGSVVDGGICCGANQYNDGGQCCDVGTAVCGSSGCCPGTCENEACVSNSNGCIAAGGSGSTCNTVTDCPNQGGYDMECTQGCCFYQKNIP